MKQASLFFLMISSFFFGSEVAVWFNWSGSLSYLLWFMGLSVAWAIIAYIESKKLG